MKKTLNNKCMRCVPQWNVIIVLAIAVGVLVLAARPWWWHRAAGAAVAAVWVWSAWRAGGIRDWLHLWAPRALFGAAALLAILWTIEAALAILALALLTRILLLPALPTLARYLH